MAREGLCSEGYAAKLFDVPVRALTTRTTGSYWVRKQVEQLLAQTSDEEAAVRDVMVRLARLQRDIPLGMTDFIGIADLET